MDERLLQGKNIIFDIGNVLLRFRPERVCEGIPKEMRADVYRAMFEPLEGSCRWAAFDVGRRPNEEIAADIARAAGHPGAGAHILNTLNNFPETLEEMPLASCIPALQEMGKKVYALTNYPEPSFTLTAERFPFLTRLDGYVVSAREKVAKPDTAIFRLILEKYALRPEETLFVDDSAANIEAARKMGLITWHYQGWQEMK